MRLLRALHRGHLPGPIARSRLIELAFGHIEGELDTIVGGEPRAVQTLIAAVLAERTHLRADPPQLAFSGVALPGTRSRDTLEQVRELLGGALESVLLMGVGLGDDRRLMKGVSAVMQGRDLSVRLLLDAHGEADPRAAASAFVAAHFRDRSRLEPYVCVGAKLSARAVVVDGRQVFVTSADLTALEDDGAIQLGAVFEAPSYAKTLHEECERLIAKGLFVPV